MDLTNRRPIIMKINRSSGNLRMSHQLLNIRKINTFPKKMSSKRMTKSVATEGLITRELIRDTFKISANGRLNTWRSKVGRMMRNNSSWILFRLPEAMIP